MVVLVGFRVGGERGWGGVEACEIVGRRVDNQ